MSVEMETREEEKGLEACHHKAEFPIFYSPQEATFAFLADLSQEPRQGRGRCRFLRRTNNCLPSPVRFRYSRP